MSGLHDSYWEAVALSDHQKSWTHVDTAFEILRNTGVRELCKRPIPPSTGGGLRH